MAERTDVSFQSQGIICRAWHYLPEDTGEPRPCVVIGHGFGATRDCRLEQYSEPFAEQGYHVLVFDYRHFGASGGEPRQVLSVRRQLQDWQAALDAARALPGVDPERIAAFGASFGGGHSLVASARDGRVKAAMSLCPMMDGRAAFLTALKTARISTALKATTLGVVDLLRAVAGAGTTTIPIAGRPGTLAALSTEDTVPGYQMLTPDDWINEVAARIVLTVGFHRPIREAHKVPCPLLMLVCDEDSVAPASAAVATAERVPDCELHRFPIGHFDIYQGEHHERALALMLDFLERNL
jgi:dienelactone hydrolase